MITPAGNITYLTIYLPETHNYVHTKIFQYNNCMLHVSFLNILSQTDMKRHMSKIALNPFSAGSVFIRHNLTSTDVRL